MRLAGRDGRQGQTKKNSVVDCGGGGGCHQEPCVETEGSGLPFPTKVTSNYLITGGGMETSDCLPEEEEEANLLVDD